MLLQIENEAHSLKEQTEDPGYYNQAIAMCEEGGVVVIDEIDKIVHNPNLIQSSFVEGVQRDLLPLIDGSRVDIELPIPKQQGGTPSQTASNGQNVLKKSVSTSNILFIGNFYTYTHTLSFSFSLSLLTFSLLSS